MYEILASRLVTRTRPAATPGFDQLIRYANDTLDQYVQWCNQAVTTVASNHLLVSLLITLTQKVGYDPNYTVQDLYNRVNFLLPDMASTFGLTYATHTGKAHVGENGNPTLYLLGESPLRTRISRDTPYVQIVPWRYLAHSSTNLSLASPAVAEPGIGTGVDVIELDLGLLLLQYFLWVREQLGQTGDDRRSLTSFVSMMVLPTLKLSQFAVAYMNRLTANAKGLPVDDRPYRFTRAFVDRSRTEGQELMNLTSTLLKRENQFGYLLEAIPVPGVWGNLGDQQTLPDLPPTRQVTWALLIARYNLTDMLYALNRISPERARQYGGEVNGIRRTVNRCINDGSLVSGLPPRERVSVLRCFEQLLAQAEY